MSNNDALFAACAALLRDHQQNPETSRHISNLRLVPQQAYGSQLAPTALNQSQAPSKQDQTQEPQPTTNSSKIVQQELVAFRANATETSVSSNTEIESVSSTGMELVPYRRDMTIARNSENPNNAMLAKSIEMMNQNIAALTTVVANFAETCKQSEQRIRDNTAVELAKHKEELAVYVQQLVANQQAASNAPSIGRTAPQTRTGKVQHNKTIIGKKEHLADNQFEFSCSFCTMKCPEKKLLTTHFDACHKVSGGPSNSSTTSSTKNLRKNKK